MTAKQIMKTFLSFWFCLWCLQVSIDAKQDLIVKNVHREIQLVGAYAEISTLYTFKLPTDNTKSELVTCLRRKQSRKEAYFKAYLGKSDQGLKLETGTVSDELEVPVPEGMICKAIKIPNEFKEDSKEINIFTTGVLVDVMHPLPAEINQHERQKMMYRDNLVTLIPYPSQSQSTTVFLPSGEVLSKTMTEPHQQRESTLMYGPFSNVERYNSQSLAIHFVHANQFLTIQNAIKEVQVSPWGRIYVNELYEMENTGAKVKGSWSRLDYFTQKTGREAVIEELRAEVPLHSEFFYYTDDIGNISSSRLVSSGREKIAALRPRYPLYGGWKSAFNFGYTTGLYGYLWYRRDDHYELHLKFSPSISYPVIKNYELRVHQELFFHLRCLLLQIVLPDGSSEIKYKLPFKVESSFDVKYWYFDVVGRPVLILKKHNVLKNHQTTFSVVYNAPFLAPYRKPFVFFFVYLGLLVAFMMYLRMNFEIVGSNEETKERIRSLLSQLKVVFTQRESVLESLRAFVAEMKNGQVSKKSLTNKSKIEEKLKASISQVQELRSSLSQIDSYHVSQIDDLISKEKDLEERCWKCYSQKAGQSDDRSGHKQSADTSEVMQKDAANLSAAVHVAFDNLFRSE